MAQIKTRKGVSNNLIVAINVGMNGSRRLGRQGRCDRGGVLGSPNSTRPSPKASWRRGDLDSLTLGWQQMAVAAGDGETTRHKLGVYGGGLQGSSG
jgi:hypothetical protein